jgi:hypothetical protein
LKARKTVKLSKNTSNSWRVFKQLNLLWLFSVRRRQEGGGGGEEEEGEEGEGGEGEEGEEEGEGEGEER